MLPAEAHERAGACDRAHTVGRVVALGASDPPGAKRAGQRPGDRPIPLGDDADTR
jgi:hypothetical protein